MTHGVLVCLGLVLASPEARANSWFISADGCIGRANETIENSLGSFHFESIGVLRGALGCGYALENGLTGCFELAWSERGSGHTARTVFSPDPKEYYQLDRSYLDVSIPWSYRLKRGSSFAGVGVSPRLSFLLDEPDIGYSGMTINRVIPGADPFFIIGYRVVHLTARYVFDLGPSYEATNSAQKAEVSDKVFFIGAGVELPI
jgi:hypothetical protein